MRITLAHMAMLLTVAVLILMVWMFDKVKAAVPLTETCYPAVGLANALKRKYGELPIGFGHLAKNVDVIVSRDPLKGSWTVFEVNRRNGLACVLAAGRDWQTLPKRKEQRRPK